MLSTQQTVGIYSSPDLEQQFAATVASQSSNISPLYVLYGNGWAIGSDDADTNDLEYAQRIIGGSLVTYAEGQVTGFE